MVNKMAFNFLLNVFETILGLDLENSSSKANCNSSRARNPWKSKKVANEKYSENAWNFKQP